MAPGLYVLIVVIFYVLYSYSLQRLCRRLDIKPLWLAWTPLSTILIYKAGEQAWWWFILLMIPYIQLIALFVLLIAWIKIFKKTGWKISIVPAISFPLMVISIGASIFFLVMNFISSSAPYEMAVNQVKNNPLVFEQFGKPIAIGWITTGNIETSNDRGLACLQIPVSGSKASGVIYVDAVRQDGEWKFRQLFVTNEQTNQPILLFMPSPDYDGFLCFK
uniref:Uncharacterized protein n=1 Tax=Cyanothece sp. (strain PCC 7425 / ATCC 29141) TaxID=395961 RepID=B8HQS1_CYAP4